MPDIIRNAFLEGFSSIDVTTEVIIVALTIALILAVYIFFVYRGMTKKTFYSRTFNVTLAIMPVITCGLVLTLQTSFVISLGTVGALSIIRFRTAVKEPMDLMFLFWSISTGIICGAGLAEIACIMAVVVTIGVFVLDRLPVAKAPMILIINSDHIDSEKEILETVARYAAYTVKSRNMTKDSLDMTIEVRCKDGAALIQDVVKLEGITAASLLAHDGEVTY